MTRIGIIVGSTRPGRHGDRVASWVRDLAAEHAGGAAEFELVDLKDYALPLLDEPVPAAMAPGRQPHTRRWAERIGPLDAFIVVTPEYNTAPPAALTNAIDYLYEEWGGKPVAYVGYGIFGAVMAVQKLRAQAGPLRMADIGPQVALSLREDFVAFTDFRPQDLHVAQVQELVDELLAWAKALGPLRTVSRAAA
ncbi:NAD(P)H-dependent oxidoreductase [Streptomyces sp. NBC_00638]|uniref:NADPH-dependent FMN reductase n=1 Tax=unclassified Streptomyces TaxID=2593676 RepID=UPI0022533CA3|nr:NAD(P)H-dependent oxidoreductase [Streptomyces sp. NBC_00638]MCX5009291.1 NAD(P)H-dependent oxidoreductase [Streptomyces sp. NBC_00638]